jgi:hypothetical protein
MLVTYLFRYTGQVLGVSLSGAALQSILTTQLRTRITGPGAAELIERIRSVLPFACAGLSIDS